MSNQTNERAKIEIKSTNNEVWISIGGNIPKDETPSWTVRAQDALTILFEKSTITEAYYIDDIFEVTNNYPFFYGEIQSLIIGGQSNELKKRITDINFDLPGEALDQEIKKVWESNNEKRDRYLEKVVAI